MSLSGVRISAGRDPEGMLAGSTSARLELNARLRERRARLVVRRADDRVLAQMIESYLS
jgi:hypothetical protein